MTAAPHPASPTSDAGRDDAVPEATGRDDAPPDGAEHGDAAAPPDDDRRHDAIVAVTSDEPGAVQVSGHDGAFAVRDFLTRNRIAYGYRPADGPVKVTTADGRELTQPALRDLAVALDCDTTARREHYDVVVVGAGPAGLAAAVYGAAEGLRVLVVEAFAVGGQAGTTSLIENYPGFTDGISGRDLAERTRLQALRLGAEVVLASSVVDGGSTDDGYRRVVLDDGSRLTAGALVCATGVAWRRLDVPGIERLDARGVFYGAATSEAPGVVDRDVVIVGGGNSAGQAALYFARWARRVTIAVRGEALSATLSRYLLERIEAAPTIDVLTRTQVTAASGDDWLRTVTLSRADGGEEEREVHALFVCIGGVPQTGWAADRGVCVDASGYLVTGVDLLTPPWAGAWPLEREPDPMETSSPRMYAIGDVRHGSTKRIATAMGDGALVIKTVQDRLVAEGLA